MIQVNPVEDQLEVFKNELNDELSRILNYWIENTPDIVHGGFLGRINRHNQSVPGAPKGSVLNARLLWTFSAAYRLKGDKIYLQYANRAYQYIINHFIDKEYGGVYWTVDHAGQPLDTKKQAYAIAFTIYGLSEYYRACGDENAKAASIELYYNLVEHSYDANKTGYLEAFTREWQPTGDLRLSAKDANEKKTMNTHLHIMEAYTNLYRIWPDDGLRTQIATLINNFHDHFINAETHHLNLFFDEDWNKRSSLVSFGHDIEAAWLLQESAEVINDTSSLKKIKEFGIGIAEAIIEGLDADGGLWYEYEPTENRLVKEKHWWVQAEAMVGFYNAWQNTGDNKYLGIAEANWTFVKNNIRDTLNGEWFWGINAKGEVMPGEDRAGIWKCPYHNSRACMEIIKRIDGIKL